MEPTQKANNIGVDKENVMYIHNDIFVSHKEEWSYVAFGKLMYLEMIILSKLSQFQNSK